MSQTYVYDGIEVVLTGRTASKPLRSGKSDTVVEITPLTQQVGLWRQRWVRPAELYIITKQDNYE